MKHPLHIGTRRVLAVLFWLLLGAGFLREGTEWALRQSLSRILHVAAPDAQFHLLRLSVESEGGEGSWRGLGVRWQGVQINLFKGGSVDLFELGPALAPILRARNISFARVWPLVTGTVMRVEVSPFRPEWSRFASEPGGGTPWQLAIPFRVHARQITADTPWGHWQGPGALEGEGTGKRGRWSLELFKGDGRLEAQGRWAPEGVSGEVTVRAAEGGIAHGVLDWGEKGTSLRLEAGDGIERWLADVQGKPGKTLEVSLVRGVGDGGRPGETLSFQIERGETPEAWPVIANVAGRVRLPDLKLGAGLAFLEGRIAADPQGAAEPGQRCVALLITGRMALPERSFVVNSSIMAQGNPTNAAEALIEGRAMPVPRPLIEDLPPVAYWRLVADKGPDTARVAGAFRAGFSVVEAEVVSLERGWQWVGAWTFPSGSARVTGRWVGERWSTGGSFDFKQRPPLAKGWILPAPPLKGTFDADGTESGAQRLNLEARGSGLYRVALTPAGWKAEVRGGELAGPDLTVKGLDVTASGKGSPTMRAGSSLRADVVARDCTLGGQELGRVGVKVTTDGAREMRLRADTELKFLNGRGTIEASRKGVAGWTLSKGQVSLLDGSVQFSKLTATWSGRMEEPAHWRAEEAHIYGEGLSAVEGRCAATQNQDGVVLGATVSHWGGEITAELPLGGGAKPNLRLAAKEVQAAPILPYIRQWVELPLKAGEGKVTGEVTIPLDDPTEGLAMEVSLGSVDVHVPDEAHTLPRCTGRFGGVLSGGAFVIPESSLALDDGKVPVTFSLHQDASSGTRFSFATPLLDAGQLQKSAFDFLPELLGYGTFQGSVAASGAFSAVGDQVRMDLSVRAEGVEFMSEDKSLRLRGVTGTLPIPLHLGGKEPEFGGYLQPSRLAHVDAFKQLEHVSGEGQNPLTMDRIRYSVFTADKLKLFARNEDGTLVLSLTDADLWGGHLRASLRLGLSGEGLRYAGQFLGRDLSLKAFCEQSGALKGFISGTAEASLTVGGDAVGASRAKALAEVWVDPEGPEPLVISRDFLVKMGGEKIRSLLHSDILEYDQAALTCGLSAGTLSVYELELSHKANPLKALMRKDVSFEVKVPQRNSISLDQLFKNIKNLEVQAGIGRGHTPKRGGKR